MINEEIKEKINTLFNDLENSIYDDWFNDLCEGLEFYDIYLDDEHLFKCDDFTGNTNNKHAIRIGRSLGSAISRLESELLEAKKEIRYFAERDKSENQ